MAMYPEYSESHSDLKMLPLCDGPKLGPFNFKGPQEIQFLEHIGEGAHSHVFQVRIQGEIYALKLFRFVGVMWLPMAAGACPPNPREQAAFEQDSESFKEECRSFVQYCEPFNAECRAFGRLKEAKCEDLAIGCFGYVLLSDENEVSLKRKFDYMWLSFDGDSWTNLPKNHRISWRTRFPGKKDKRPPIRGILKEFGQEARHLTDEHFEQMRRTTVVLQRQGIVCRDIHLRQFINSKLADFSLACTTPHFALNTELNENLTPEQKSSIDFEVFWMSLDEYWAIDDAVADYNEDQQNSQSSKGDGKRPGIKVCGIPDTGLSLGPDEFYTCVDPRSYD